MVKDFAQSNSFCLPLLRGSVLKTLLVIKIIIDQIGREGYLELKRKRHDVEFLGGVLIMTFRIAGYSGASY